MDIEHVCTEEQIVDILTKTLEQEQFYALRARLGVIRIMRNHQD
jgi:hypothetical protein